MCISGILAVVGFCLSIIFGPWIIGRIVMWVINDGDNFGVTWLLGLVVIAVAILAFFIFGVGSELVYRSFCN